MMGSNEKVDSNYYEEIRLKTLKRQYVNTMGDADEVIKLIYPNGATSEQYDEETIIKSLLNELFNLDNVSGVSIQGRDDAWKQVCNNAFAPYLFVVEKNDDDGYYRNYYGNKDVINERGRESILQSIREKREEGSENPYANIDLNSVIKDNVSDKIREVIKINVINSLKYRKKSDKTGRKGKPKLFFKI